MRDPAPGTEAVRHEGAPWPGTPRGRAVLTIAWCSFLTASVATMLLFALVDPAPMAQAVGAAAAPADRTARYSFGFLFLWVIGAASAGLSAWMLAPAGRAPS